MITTIIIETEHCRMTLSGDEFKTLLRLMQIDGERVCQCLEFVTDMEPGDDVEQASGQK
jgi:hypothetical protein